MLVRGDNLAVLERLSASHQGRFRCIYADPPFNTGRKFAEYNDAWGPGVWREMMSVRLAAMRPLLAEDGAIFVEIDDTQLGDLLALMDDTFGRQNRVSTVTVVRSASTGHKAINRGPTNVSDFLLVYAKNRSAWRAHPQWKRRDGRDRAYSTYVVNRDEPLAGWTFEPLAKAVARSLGHSGGSAATRALGADGFERAVLRFSLENATRVVRFAQPRYDAVSLEARRWIDRSTKHPETVIVLERGELRPLVLRAGNRILFLSDKVRIEKWRTRSRRAAHQRLERRSVSGNLARGRGHLRSEQETGAPPRARPSPLDLAWRLGARSLSRQRNYGSSRAQNGKALCRRGARKDVR